MEKIAKNHKAFFHEILRMKQKLISFAISAVIIMVLLPDTFAFSESIKWYSHDEGIAVGSSEGKRIYINFHADWCAYCKVMEKETFSNPAVISYLNKYFISIKVDTEKETKTTYKYGVNALPDNWFLFKNGEIIGRRKGYIPPDMFMKILKSIPEDISAKKKD
jgi:thioredoxin-related protein